MRGDFTRPTQDKPLYNPDRLCMLIGAQQGQGLVLAFWVAHEHPTNRNRGDGRLIPQSHASGDLHLARWYCQLNFLS